MTNKDIILAFIDGSEKFGATNHTGFSENRLFNYSTLMCEIDRKNKKARVNIRKYSTSTSKIQSMIRAALIDKNYMIDEFVGDPCTYWNMGYQGAARYNKRDFAI